MSKPEKISKHRIVLVGGPWAGLVLYVRPRASEQDAMSLPITVGTFTGRYNLVTGDWVDA